MLIELHGAGFTNKGAQLMLHTVVEQVRSVDEAVRFCVDDVRGRAVGQFSDLGVYRIFLSTRARRPRSVPAAMLFSRLCGAAVPRRLLAARQLVRRSDACALIDLSGYAFGEKWSAWHSRNFGHRAREYARRGQPVVLLPQMLGPFTSREHREAFLRIYSAATLIYARDRVSYDAVADVLDGEVTKLRRAPDVTIATPPDDSMPLPSSDYASIVPNSRLLDAGSAAWRDRYLPTVIQSISYLRECGLEVFVVLHEVTSSDRALAREIARGAGVAESRIVEEQDPRRLKAFLGGSKVVVSSRYHSIVSSLSSGVPSIVFGWAHKYETLLEDFASPDWIHRPEDTPQHLERRINDALANESTHRTRLLARKTILVGELDQMWHDVANALGNSNAPA